MNIRKGVLAVAALLLSGSIAACSGGTGTVRCDVTTGPSPTPTNAQTNCYWETGAPATPTNEPTKPPATTDPTTDPTDPPPTDPPTPDPTTDPTNPPAEEIHGEEINFSNTGPGDTSGFAVRAGGNITTPTTLDHVIINGNITLRANFTCNYCVINGSPGTASSSYTVRMTAAQSTPEGTVFECNYCDIISNNPIAKNIGATSGYGVFLYRSIVRGGGDGLHLNLFPNASAARTIEGHSYQGAIVESFVTHSDRSNGSHTDAIQFEGASSAAPGYLVLRSRVQGCNPPFANDGTWCTDDNDGTIANAAIIATYPSTPGQHTRVDIKDSCAIGGNYEIFMEDDITVNTISGNRTGGNDNNRYGSILGASGADISDNEVGGCEVIVP